MPDKFFEFSLSGGSAFWLPSFVIFLFSPGQVFLATCSSVRSIPKNYDFACTRTLLIFEGMTLITTNNIINVLIR